MQFAVCNGQSHHERKHQSAHYLDDRRYLYGEIRCDGNRLFYFGNICRFFHHSRKQPTSRTIGKDSRNDRIEIGNGNGDKQQLTCRLTDVGDSWRYQSHDDKGNHKAKKLAEYGIERSEYAHPRQ